MGKIERIYRGIMKRWIFKTSPTHTEAFRRWTDWRRSRDGSDAAVGGSDSDTELGKLQFEFLQNQGLEPSDRLLDVGCGTLRGGQYFIKYLNSENYSGMDINADLIEDGKKKLSDELISRKQPRFVINSDLKFDEFQGASFDYLIAQSVFTHLPKHEIEECFENVSKVMHSNSVFYATIFTSETHGHLKSGLNNYVYDLETIADLAIEKKFETEVILNDYPHPRRQRMLGFYLED